MPTLCTAKLKSVWTKTSTCSSNIKTQIQSLVTHAASTSTPSVAAASFSQLIKPRTLSLVEVAHCTLLTSLQSSKSGPSQSGPGWDHSNVSFFLREEPSVNGKLSDRHKDSAVSKTPERLSQICPVRRLEIRRFLRGPVITAFFCSH